MLIEFDLVLNFLVSRDGSEADEGGLIEDDEEASASTEAARELALPLGPTESSTFDALKLFLRSSACSDAVISSRFGLRVTEEMMSRLRPTGWLNDEIINFYMHLLQDRTVPTTEWNVLIFETHFMAKLWENNSYQLGNVVRYCSFINFSFCVDCCVAR